MNNLFVFDERLGIHVPELTQDWLVYSIEQRSAILERWENERGLIPQRVHEFETEIASLHDAMQDENEWDRTVALMDQINDYASRINDLNILFRTEPHLEPTSHDEHEERDHLE